MDAKKINDVLKGLENFGGIYDADQLDNVKILSLPVMIIINSEEHWIGLFVDQENIEIMDSIALINEKKINGSLCRFLCAQIKGKKLTASPKLQSDESSDCGKYAVSFLVYKSLTSNSLKDFLKIFTADCDSNSKNIRKLFQTIQNLMKNLKTMTH